MQATEKKNTYTNATSGMGDAINQKDTEESNANVSLPSTSKNKTQDEEQKLNAKYNQLQMEHINMQKQYNQYLLQNPSSTFSFMAGFAVGAAVMGVAFIVVSVIRRKN